MSKKAEEERVASEAAVLAPAIKSEKAAAPKTGSKLPSKAAVSKFLVFSVFALFIFFLSFHNLFFFFFLYSLSFQAREKRCWCPLVCCTVSGMASVQHRTLADGQLFKYI